MRYFISSGMRVSNDFAVVIEVAAPTAAASECPKSCMPLASSYMKARRLTVSIVEEPATSPRLLIDRASLDPHFPF